MVLVRKLVRLVSLLGVLIVAILAGLFLSACRRVADVKPPEGETGRPAEDGTPEDRDEGRAKERPDRPAVDVDETEEGQPVPRNLLE